MTDFCLICETEPIENTGWFVSVDDACEAICPWCVKDMDKIRELVKTHDGSDYHARQLFDDIDELVTTTHGGSNHD